MSWSSPTLTAALASSWGSSAPSAALARSLQTLLTLTAGVFLARLAAITLWDCELADLAETLTASWWLLTICAAVTGSLLAPLTGTLALNSEFLTTRALAAVTLQ